MESFPKVTQHKQFVFLMEVKTTDFRSGIGKSKWTFLWQNLKSYIHFYPPPKHEANICLSFKSCSGSMCSEKPSLLYSQSASPHLPLHPMAAISKPLPERPPLCCIVMSTQPLEMRTGSARKSGTILHTPLRNPEWRWTGLFPGSRSELEFPSGLGKSNVYLQRSISYKSWLRFRDHMALKKNRTMLRIPVCKSCLA